MLNLNCLLADLTNKLRIANSYGICTDKLVSLVKCVSSYQWLYNNAWDCLDQCQKNKIDSFLKSNFNGYSYSMCEDEVLECTDTPTPNNDNCSGAIFINYPTGTFPNIEVRDLFNGYTCNVVDYPSDSGIPLPDSWDLSSSGDLWYKFETGNSIITEPYITITTGTLKYPQFTIYEGVTCADLFLVQDAENLTEQSNYTKPSLTKNTTYYIRVSNAGGNVNTGTFNITISLFPVV